MIGCVHSSATKRFYTFFSFCLRAREILYSPKEFRDMTVSSKQRRFQLEKKKICWSHVENPRQRQQLERTIYDRLSHSVLEQYFCWKPIFVAHFRYICLIPPKKNTKNFIQKFLFVSHSWIDVEFGFSCTWNLASLISVAAGIHFFFL